MKPLLPRSERALPRRPRIDGWLLALMAVGLAIRVAATLLLDAGMHPRGDEVGYLREAAAFRRTGILETGFDVRPPLYFVLLAGFGSLADWIGASVGLVTKLFQCLASCLTAIPVYRTTRRVGGVVAARVAVAFLMFDATLIAYTHLLWPETFFLLLVAIVFDGVAAIEQRPAAVRALLGVAIGLALLLKPAFGLFTLLLAGYWWLRLGPKRALRLALLVGGVAALVISPWVVRNQLRYGPAIILENQGPYNLWMGNDPRPPRQILQEWKSLDPLSQARTGTQRGLEAIARDPGAFAANFVRRALNLWGLEFFVVRHAIIGGYGRIDRGTFLLLFWVVQLSYAIHLLAAAAGLRSAARDPTLRLVLVYAAAFTAMVAALVVTTRWRVPFAFLTAAAAGLSVERLRTRSLGRPDLAAVAAALGLLAISLSRPLFLTIASGSFARVHELSRWSWRFFRY